jgi:hypothetical protein
MAALLRNRITTYLFRRIANFFIVVGIHRVYHVRWTFIVAVVGGNVVGAINFAL